MKITINNKFNKGKVVVTYKFLFLMYLVSFLIIPNYAGIKISMLPLITAQRFFLVIIYISTFLNRKIQRNFVDSFKQNKFTFPIIIYLIVCLITTFFTGDINAFFGPLVDQILAFYLISYCFKNYLKLDEFLNIIKYLICFLGVLGIFEQITGFNIFTLLDSGMTQNLNNGSLTRDNVIRICTAFGHPLAYGLFLVIFFPLICYDINRKAVYILQNPILVILVVINVVLSGSRSCIATIFSEIFIILILSDKKRMGNILVSIISLALVTGTLIFIFYDTSFIEGMLRQIFYVIDELFGTNMALQFGGNSSIKNSSLYRDLLWSIFTNESFSYFIGKGTIYKTYLIINNTVVKSVDNFYIAMFIRYAIPGVVSILYIFYTNLKNAFLNFLSNKNRINYLLILSTIAYLFNLLIVDELATLKFMFIIFSITNIYGKNKDMMNL